MANKKKGEKHGNLAPQKSSAAQFLTYVASTGAGGERFELRYEDENIWMSQKTLAAVYGVEVPNIAYHLRKLFDDAELAPETSIKEFLIDVGDGRKFNVKHYNLQTIVAIGFKIDNERAVQFRKWANQIVSQYTIQGWVMDTERFIHGTPLARHGFLSPHWACPFMLPLSAASAVRHRFVDSSTCRFHPPCSRLPSGVSRLASSVSRFSAMTAKGKNNGR